MKNLIIWLQITPCTRYFCIKFSENRPEYSEFGFHGMRPPTCGKISTHKTFVLQRFILFRYTSISILHIILLSRDLKTKKVRHHPSSTIPLKSRYSGKKFINFFLFLFFVASRGRNVSFFLFSSFFCYIFFLFSFLLFCFFFCLCTQEWDPKRKTKRKEK